MACRDHQGDAHALSDGPQRTTDAQRDDEWSRLPRNRRPFLTLVRRNPSFLEPDELFRNIWLNPRDSYIPESERRLFSAAINAVKPSRIAFQQAKAAFYGDTVLANANKARQTSVPAPIVRVKRTGREGTAEMYRVPTQAMAEQGIDFATVRDGVVFGLAKKDLPGCSALVGMERFADFEFGSLLLSWFKAQGALSEREATELAASLHPN